MISEAVTGVTVEEKKKELLLLLGGEFSSYILYVRCLGQEVSRKPHIQELLSR